jgi:MFS family permease
VNRNLYFAFGGIFCLIATQTMALVLIPLAAAAVNLPGFAIGVLVAVTAGVSLATDVPVGVISDRRGRKVLILCGAGVGILAGILLSLGGDFPILFLGALAVGLSLSFAIGPALAYVSETCVPKDAARVQGYNGAVQGLGALAGALVVGLAVDHIGLARSSLLISLLMAVSGLAFVALDETVARDRMPSVRELIGSYRAASKLLVERPALQLSTLVSLLSSSVVSVIGNSFLPLYVVRDLRQPAVFAGTLVAARNVAMTIASPLFGRAVARFGLPATMLGANFIAVAGMIGVWLVPDPHVLYVPLALAGFGNGFAAATVNTLVTAATSRRERALGFATNGLGSRAGSLVSPLIFGTILGTWGSPAVFASAGILGTGYLVAMAARLRIGTDSSVGLVVRENAEKQRLSLPANRIDP